MNVQYHTRSSGEEMTEMPHLPVVEAPETDERPLLSEIELEKGISDKKQKPRLTEYGFLPIALRDRRPISTHGENRKAYDEYRNEVGYLGVLRLLRWVCLQWHPLPCLAELLSHGVGTMGLDCRRRLMLWIAFDVHVQTLVAKSTRSC